MNNQLRIGVWEAVATIGCISLIPILLTIPTLATESFGTAAFLHNIYTAVLTFIIITIIFSLYKNFSNMDLIDVYEYTGGKFLKIIGGTFAILYLITLSILTFAQFSQNVQNVVFPDAPQEYISILFGWVMVISVLLGIRGIFRTGSIVAPLIILGILLIFVSLFKDVDITNFTPIFGNGITEFWLQGPLRIGRYEGLFLILLLMPYINDYKKTGYLSFAITTLLIIPTVFILVGIIPYPSVTENYLPMFELTRLISFGRFVQRVESIFVLLWLLDTFIYLSLSISLILIIFQKVFNLKYTNRIIIVLVGIVVTTSVILNSFEVIIWLRNFVFLYVAPIAIYVIPIILLLFANLKRRHQCKKLILENSSS